MLVNNQLRTIAETIMLAHAHGSQHIFIGPDGNCVVAHPDFQENGFTEYLTTEDIKKLCRDLHTPLSYFLADFKLVDYEDAARLYSKLRLDATRHYENASTNTNHRLVLGRLLVLKGGLPGVD